MGITTLLGAVLALAGCGDPLTCGEGTIEVDGECVAADTDGSGDDGSGDGGTDSGTSSDDSGSTGDAGGTDSGGEETVSPKTALLLLAVGDDGCRTGARITVSAPKELQGTHYVDYLSDNLGWTLDDGETVVVSSTDIQRCSGGYASSSATWVVGLDGYLAFASLPDRDHAGWQEAGVDYDPDTVRVVFEDGIGTSYAESLIADTPASIRTTVGEDPPQYLLQPEGGATAPQVAAELLVLPDVSWAMPEPL